MNTALIIGKFMPPHRGHEAMILWAKEHFRRVVVLVGALAGEPIPGPLRMDWMVRTFESYPEIQVEYTDEPLPTAPQADSEVSRVWAHYLKTRFPDVGCLVSSENYGPLVAGFMEISHQFYDLPRKSQPISARMIRANPLKYWDFILPSARPYFVKKICLYGPESTGKTVMAEKLAKYFKTRWVSETAREILDENGFTLNPQVIDRIAVDHAARIKAATNEANKFLFVDSDIITTQIYGKLYCDYIPIINDEIKQANSFDLYLLFDVDVPWVLDAQRMESGKREEFFDVFKGELDRKKMAYIVVSGNYEWRFERILKEIKGRFGVF